jgi:hypothetical protein
VVLESVARRGRQLLSPQGINEVVHAHHATAAEREQREQAVPFVAADVHRTSADGDLKRPEEPDLE